MAESTEQNAKPGITQNRLVGAIYLVLFAIAAAWLLANAQKYTRQRIADNELAARLKDLQVLLPHGRFDNEPHKDFIFVTDAELLGSRERLPVYRIRRGQTPVGAVVTAVAPNGFSGKIRLLVSIDLNGEVLGVRVTSHTETPGLGDAIESGKSDWINGFAGLGTADPLENAWILSTDGGSFDKISGATVSSRAVLGAARNAVLYFNSNNAELFSAPSMTLPE
jgi:electron transport complex protein RnfG